jgi:acyl-CoA thioester hydrolase
LDFVSSRPDKIDSQIVVCNNHIGAAMRRRKSTAGTEMTPHLGYSVCVPDAWIDVNGHMNAQFYYVLFYEAGIDFASHLGLGPGLPGRSGRGQAVVESHTRFEHENLLGDQLLVKSLVTNFDRKRIHFFHQLFNITRGYRAATMEQLELHIDVAQRRTTDFTADLIANFEAMTALQGPLPRPDEIGRQVQFGRSA